MSEQSWINIAGFILGGIGTALGVINTWADIRRDRIRLKIYTEMVFVGGDCCAPHITVVNIGAVPVTIKEIGFISHCGRRKRPTDTCVSTGNFLPELLEAGASITARFPAGIEKTGDFISTSHVYAITACGSEFKFRDKGLRDILNSASSTSGDLAKK